MNGQPAFLILMHIGISEILVESLNQLTHADRIEIDIDCLPVLLRYRVGLMHDADMWVCLGDLVPRIPARAMSGTEGEGLQ